MEISQLLSAINKKEIVVPEFQREYVWRLEQAKELMTSLFKDYPTGSILVWPTNKPPKIKNNAVDIKDIGTVRVLLDGQQRLTTLYLLIKGQIPPYYREDDITNDPRHLYFNLETGDFNYYQKQKMEGNSFWKRVVDCFNDDFDIFSLENDIKEKGGDFSELGRKINNNIGKLKSILREDYHIQQVPDGVEIDEAIDIFDRVNSKGTKLTDAELVLTHIAGKWPEVREKMKESIREYRKTGFDFSLDFLTRCMTIIITKSALFEKMNDEIYKNTREEDYKEKWKNLTKIFNYLLPILKENGYINGSGDLSTNNVLVPIVAYISQNSFSFPNTPIRNYFLYWMFLASVWGRYSSRTDQSLDRDVYLAINSQNPIDDLLKEIEDQRGRLEVKQADLEGRGSAHPLYKMLGILARYNKAIDWKNGGSLNETLGEEYAIHSHHIFPQGLLYKNGYTSDNHLDKKIVNEIANRAFITRDANLDISDKKPLDYLREIKKKYPEALKQQFIPEFENLWDIGKFRDFLAERRILIAQSINDFLDNLKAEGEKIEIDRVDYEKIIERGEDNYIEFKSSLRWDMNRNTTNSDLKKEIAKAMSAFMNTEGGRLFIGVNDEGEILGLDNDYKTLGTRQNKDGFLQKMDQVVENYLGREFFEYISIKIIKIDDKDVCLVELTNSGKPVYLKLKDKEEFYIRGSASSRPLSLSEANEYIKNHSWE